MSICLVDAADSPTYERLHSFAPPSDGSGPYAGAIEGRYGALYGTSELGGPSNHGTVFRLNPDGSDFSAVLNFDNSANGSSPLGQLYKETDGAPCGTTAEGGDANAGTVFRLGFGPCAGLADGTVCDDGNACTQTDTCQAGVRVGTNYSWSGVLPPVSADGTSVFKVGSTIPTKCKLTGACSGKPDLIANVTFFQGSSGDAGTVFRYSASDDQYVYNLGTKGLTPGIWNLGIDLHDGTGIRTVTVRLRN